MIPDNKKQDLERGYWQQVEGASNQSKIAFYLESMTGHLMILSSLWKDFVSASRLKQMDLALCIQICIERLRELIDSEQTTAMTDECKEAWLLLSELYCKLLACEDDTRSIRNALYLTAAVAYVVESHVCGENLDISSIPEEQRCWLNSLPCPFLIENQSFTERCRGAIASLREEIQRFSSSRCAS
jgi:hypothetical protein